MQKDDTLGLGEMRVKLQLILLFLLFATPPVVAYLYFFVYKGSFSVTGAATANYGELVQPARYIEPVALNSIDGSAYQFGDLYTKWTLVYVGRTLCDQICAEHLYNIHQVRLTQGKDRTRVTSVYVLPDNAPDTLIAETLGRLPNMLVLIASSDAYTKLIRQFEIDGDPGQANKRAYIIDPLGNLMMSYPTGSDPSKMRKDLKKLLKVSQIG